MFCGYVAQGEPFMTRLGTASFLALLAWIQATPASAQADFSGVWQPRYHEDQPERIPGPELKDYLGLPINDAARQFADSWDSSRITLPEEQCRVHTSPYIMRGLNCLAEVRDLAWLNIVAPAFNDTRRAKIDKHAVA
jgi:hypothetical protein